MADRFAALAGYAGGDDSDYTGSIDPATVHAPAQPTLPDQSADTSEVPARPAIPPRRTISGSSAPHGGARRVPITQTESEEPATPKADKQASGRHLGKANEPPSTEKKKDEKRRHQVRVAQGEDSLDARIARRGAGVGASEASSDEDDVDVDQSESAELRQMHRNLSNVDTTQGSSLDDGADGGLDPNPLTQRRRGGELLSLKSAQERIETLTFERNELKQEVDFHRQKMSPSAVSAELIQLRIKELQWTSKERLIAKNLTTQYQTLKEQKKRNKVLEAKLARLEADGGQGGEHAEAQLREALERADKERRARLRAEDEVALLRQQRLNGDTSGAAEGPEIQRLQDDIADFKSDIYRLEQDKEDLQARLEEQQAQRDERREENSRTMEREHREEIADLQQDLARWRSESDRLQALVDRALQKQAALRSENDELAQRYEDVEAAKEELMVQLNAADGLGQAAHIENEKRIEETNMYRDRLATAQLDIEEYKALCDDNEELKRQSEEALYQLQNEVEEMAKAREDILKAFNEEREAGDIQRQDMVELDRVLDECRADLDAAHEMERNLRNEIADLDHLVQDREEECAEANEEIARISKLLQEAEQNCESQLKTIEELEADREALEDRHRLLENTMQEHVQQLKEQLFERESELQETIQRSDEAVERQDWLNKQLEELESERDQFAEKVDEILQDLKKEEEAREEDVARLEKERDDLREDLESEISGMVAEIKTLKRDAEKGKEDLAHAAEDVARLQDALRQREDESVRFGQSQANDRHSLQLEVDRLKRDLARCEMDLERERREAITREDTLKEKEIMLTRLHAEKRDLESKAASETQGRLGLDERFATQQRTLQTTQEDLDAARARLEELEHQLSQGERETLQSEQQIRTQLTERNTLLLSIYQYMGKIIGGQIGTTPRKKVDELKPFTNFGVFHDSLLARMRRLSDLQGTFEQRAKDVESKLLEQLTKLKRQQDARFRQLDRFETAVKGAVDKQGQWRARLVTKQGEVEAAKATNTELQAQLSSLRSRQSMESPADRSRAQAMSVRASTAERKLASREKELAALEERAAEQQRRLGENEGKWAARIRELEARCKAAEEKYKLERQGAKEKVAEMSEQKRYLEKQIAETGARGRKIDELKVSNKV